MSTHYDHMTLIPKPKYYFTTKLLQLLLPFFVAAVCINVRLSTTKHMHEIKIQEPPTQELNAVESLTS